MEKVFKRELVIGLCVLAALAILFFGIDFLKGVNVFKPANYYYAVYNNVEGLAVSAPVTINGYKVGLVRQIDYEYDNPGHVRVEMSLDQQLRLPSGTKAVLGSDLLGTAAIALDLTDRKEYQPVGTELEGVNSPGLMTAVGQDLMPAVSRIMPRVDSLISNLNTLTGDPALLASVRRLDAITSQLEATSRSLSVAMKSLQPVTKDVQAITGNVAGITGDVAQLTGQIKDMPVDSLMSDLLATTNNLKALSQELNNPNSTLGMLMKDPALYNNLNATVTSLDSLFVDIKRNPKRYVTIKVF